MKKIIAVITAFSLFSGIIPFAAYADDTETGVMDTSDISFEFGELEMTPQILGSVTQILADSTTDEDYFLGAHLDKNNKAVYDALSVLTEPSLDTITIKLPEPVQFKTADIENDSDGSFYNAVFGTCASGMEASSFDRPEIFWLDQNKVMVSPGNMQYSVDRKTGIYTFTIDKLIITPAAYDGFESFDEIAEYKTRLESAVSSYKIEGETIAEKLKSIHDSICLFTNYDTEGRFSGSALSALIEPGSVCEGYSKGFKMICDSIGVPAVCVFGNFDEETLIAHMWNYVRMDDGNWYAIDVTWDDYDGDYGYEVVDRFFLKGSDDFNEKHTETNDFNLTHLEYPQIVSWNYGEAPGSQTTTSTATVTTSKAATETTSTTTTISASTKTTGPTTKSTSKTTSATTSSVSETTAATTEPVQEFPYGDLNRDGKVSVADLVYCASVVLGIQEAEHSCDINEDGRVDVFDVVIMRKIVVKAVQTSMRSQGIIIS